MYPQIVQTLYSLITGFEAAFPGVPLVLANQPFDWNNPPPKFVVVDVTFLQGHQVGLSDAPATRDPGYFAQCAYVRESLGTLEALSWLSWFRDNLKHRAVGTIQLQTPSVHPPEPWKGYYTVDLVTPFYSTNA